MTTNHLRIELAESEDDADVAASVLRKRDYIVDVPVLVYKTVKVSDASKPGSDPMVDYPEPPHKSVWVVIGRK